jgi:Na+/melibiose symporter-like transporter
VQISIVFLYGMLPLICYFIGAYMFSKFTLDEKEHQRMRIELEKRRTPSAAD